MSDTEQRTQEIEKQIKDWLREGSTAEELLLDIRDILSNEVTMEGVEWSDEEHYLAEVSTRVYGNLFMVSESRDLPGWITVAGFDKEGHPKVSEMYAAGLTLTGRKAKIVVEVEEKTPEECDPSRLYADCDGDTWECIEGRWVCGPNHDYRQELIDNGYGHLNTPPYYFGPYKEIVEKTPGKEETGLMEDQAGSVWERIDGRWVCGGNHEIRAKYRDEGLGHEELPEAYGPYRKL